MPLLYINVIQIFGFICRVQNIQRMEVLPQKRLFVQPILGNINSFPVEKAINSFGFLASNLIIPKLLMYYPLFQ